MDTSQYLDIFLDESKEHLQNLSDQIMELEQNPENMDTINEIFRAAHSLKGMAGTMGYKRMQTLTHDMENVFSEVRNGTFKVQPGMIDILFKSLDALEEYVNNIQQTTEEGTNDNQDLIDALNSILKNNGEVNCLEHTCLLNINSHTVYLQSLGVCLLYQHFLCVINLNILPSFAFAAHRI